MISPLDGAIPFPQDNAMAVMVRKDLKFDVTDTFKEALNEAARAGLCGKGPKRSRKFAQKSFRMGEEQEFRWDKALAVAGAIEDEELSRKLALRK